MNKVYSKIESIVGSVITVKADNVAYGELAEIETRFGKSLAEVNKIEGDVVSLQVFAGGRGISTGDHIKFLGHQMEVSFSDNLLGRIFNGSAQPRDNGPALTDSLVKIGGPSVNPSKRIMACTGIREIIAVFRPMAQVVFLKHTIAVAIRDILPGRRSAIVGNVYASVAYAVEMQH